MNTLAKHLAALAILLIAGVATAQSTVGTVQTQSFPVASGSVAANTVKPNADMGIQQVQSLELSALRDRVTAGLTQATATLETSKLVDIYELAHNGTVHFITSANTTGPVTEQHLLNVVVRYDARPVGGILTVRSDLVPLFSGIGTSCRPTVSNQFSEAVDNLDDAVIADAIRHLTDQVQKQYASK